MRQPGPTNVGSRAPSSPTRQVKVRAHTRTIKAKQFVLTTPHDVGITARPPRRGHAPTVFDEPLGLKPHSTQARPVRTPTQKMQAAQRRHTARGLIEATGIKLNRPLKREEVRRVLNSPVAKNLAASTTPYLAKPKVHHSFFHNALHAVESVPAALTVGNNANLPGRSVFTAKQGAAADRAIQKPLKALVKGSGKLAATGQQYNTEGIGTKLNPGVGKFLQNAGKDAIELPANTLLSTYLTATHPTEVAKGTLEQLKHPVSTFLQHPVSTALILRGGEAALSRAGGNLARSGVLGKGAKDYASTTRPDLKLTGNAAVQRRASKGLLENRVQKAVDRRAIKKGRGTTVRSPTGPRPAIQATERQMFKAGPGRPMAGHLNRRIDQEVGTNAGMKTVTRTEALNSMLHSRTLFHVLKRDAKTGAQVVRTNGHEDAVPIILEGALREGHVTDPAKFGSVSDALLASRKQITDKIDALRAEPNGARKHAADIQLARDNVGRIDHLLNDPKFLNNPADAFRAAADFVRGHGNSITSHALEGERIKHGDFTLDAAQRRVVLPFAERELGLKHNEDTGTFTDASGRTVPTQEILNEFKARGGNPEHLAYVHRFRKLDNPKSYRGGGGMLQRGGASKRYTGSGTQGVLYHRSYTALAEQMAHAASRVEHHYGVTDLVNTFGHARPDGNHYWDQKSAAKEIDRLEAENPDQQWVAVTAMRQHVPQSLLDEHQPGELEESFHAPTNPDQHVVLMRKEVVDRIAEHEGLRGRNALEQGLQTATQYFRHAVLPTSTKWIAGNAIEAFGRTLINDPTVARSMIRGHKLQNALADLGPAGERQLRRLQVGASSGLFMSQKFHDFYRPNEPDFMQKIHAFRHSPVAKTVGDAWDAYRNKVVAGNERLESSVYWAGLGKEMQREVQSFTGSWTKTIALGKAAYEDVAKGLLDSNNVARYVSAVDKMRGRYSNLSPSGRRAVSTYTPFAPWYVNAIHFAAVTLPGQHPVLTGSAAAMFLGTQDQRKAQHLPPWAVGSIKGIDVNHYTPFGIYAGGSGGVAQLVLPQYSGLIHNLEGEAWTGQKLPKGTKAKVALNTALGTFLPFVSRIQTIREKGGTATPDSTLFHPKTKAGTSSTYLAGLKKATNPFRKQNYAAGNKSGLPTLDSAGSSVSLPKLDNAGGTASLPKLDGAP